MENACYDIFKTRWGWFGLLADKQALVRTFLPIPDKEALIDQILAESPDAKRLKSSFSVLKKRIKAYYEGNPDDFFDVAVRLDDNSDFRTRTLTALRRISYGKTISYGRLARVVGSPGASRAIGTVMAKNPLPLIIPCHRVIKSDGTIGQFSAAGGTNTKTRMLELEKRAQ